MLMGIIIILRYVNPRFKSKRQEILDIFKRDDINLDEKTNIAKTHIKDFHWFKGYRHSLARMVQQDLKKIGVEKEKRNTIFKEIYS
jgi:hypothetical protein